jgi:hypothetical protein
VHAIARRVAVAAELAGGEADEKGGDRRGRAGDVVGGVREVEQPVPVDCARVDVERGQRGDQASSGSVTVIVLSWS